MAESELSNKEESPVPADIRFKRFLYTGQEIPKYYPGNWSAHRYFELQVVTSLQELIADNEKCMEIVEFVLQTYENGSYSRFEALVYALVVCIKFGSENLKAAAYVAVRTVCKHSEQLMLFVKYCKVLEIGSGAGWRKCISKWYAGRTPLELAQEVTRVIGRHDFTHKDVFRLAHIKPGEDIDRQCVYTYVLYGYKKTQQLFASKSEAIEVLNIFKNIEEYKVCEDDKTAVAIMKDHGYTLDHVPPQCHSNQEIWNLAILHLSPPVLLHNIQRIHDMGFLAANSSTQEVLHRRIATLIESIKPPASDLPRDSPLRLHPIAVHIARCNYEHMGRPRKYALRKILQEKEEKRLSREAIAKFPNLTSKQKKLAESQHANDKKKGKSVKPNTVIIDSLKLLMAQSWHLPVATGHRYMITMDMRNRMFKGHHFCDRRVFKKRVKGPSRSASHAPSQLAAAPVAVEKEPVKKTFDKHKHPYAECFYNQNVVPGKAAIILALQILHRERDVTLAVFSETGVQCVNLGNRENITSEQEAESKLRGAKVGRARLAAPMDWAAIKNKRIDVFINIVDNVSRAINELPKDVRPGTKRPSRKDLRAAAKKQKTNESKSNEKKTNPSTSTPLAPPPPPPTPVEPDKECPIKALERYRQKMNLQASKLITLSLIGKNFSLNDGRHEGVLDLVGLDEHTPKVIDAFCQNYFK